MSRSITRAAQLRPRRRPNAAFDRLQPREQRRRLLVALDQRGGIGEAALRGAQRRRAQHRRHRDHAAQSRERRGHFGLGAAMAPPAIGAQSDDIACCRHGAGPIAAPCPRQAPFRHRDCPLCPRLAALRTSLRAEHPDWWNAPVPALGDPDAVAGDRRPRPRQARRQPHRPRLHRRCLGRPAVRDAGEVRAGRPEASRRAC